MQLLSDISSQLQIGKAKVVQELVQQALDQQVPVKDILEQGLLHGMSIVGAKFKNNEVFVPEVLIAARAMNKGMELLKPYYEQSGVESKGRVCIGTVQGDLHDIGKNLVKMMLEGKGFEVIDLGTDVAPETFVQTAMEKDCGIICLSALLTTTMSAMKQVVDAAKGAGIREKVKIMVGGAPVTDEFRKEIGADAYTADAASAAEKALELMESLP
ncbi:MAG: cobalamin-binding protein [Clostridiales bacterium]|jgi:corrinoid protein of di/trimethylamine methyltransferase|nr:cobalamin-binding protein [Clostridiales bacterium]